MPGLDFSAFAGPAGAAAARATAPQPQGAALDFSAAARPRSFGEDLAGFVNKVDQSIPFGQDLASGADALVALASGKANDFGTAFQQAQAARSGVASSFQQAHPRAAALASGTGIALQALPAFATGGASLGANALADGAPAAANVVSTPAAKGLLGIAAREAPTAGKLAATGGAYGVLNGLGSPGSVQDRVTAARDAVIPGMFGGVVAPYTLGGLASGGSWVANKVAGWPVSQAVARRTAGVASGLAENVPKMFVQDNGQVSPEAAARGRQMALRAITQMMTRNGITPDALNANPDVGRGITAAEAIGNEGIGAVAGYARRPGATGDMVDKNLRARGADMGERFAGDIHYQTGISPELATGGVDGLVAQGRATAKPLYEAALSLPTPVWGGDLPSLAQEKPVQQALDHVGTWMRLAGLQPDVAGEAVDPDTGAKVTGEDLKSVMEGQPTATAWDLVKKRMDRMLELDEAGNPILTGKRGGENRLVMQANQRLTQNLRDQIPGYGVALDTAGDYLKVQDAYARASNMLTRHWSPSQVQDFYANLGTQPERTAVRQAFARQLYDQVDNGTLSPSYFLGRGGGPRQALQQKLATVFSPKAADALMASANAEQRMGQAAAQMRPSVGSVTSVAMQHSADQDLSAEQAATQALQRGNLHGAVMSTLFGPAIRASGAPGQLPYRDALGGLLMMTPPDLADVIMNNGGMPPSGPPPGPRPFKPPPMAAPLAGVLGTAAAQK
jgi:hypothetical protein